MADKIVAENLKQYIERVIADELSSTEERIRVLVEVRDYIYRLLDDQA